VSVGPQGARAAQEEGDFMEIELAACKALALLRRALCTPNKPAHVSNKTRIRPQASYRSPEARWLRILCTAVARSKLATKSK